MLCPKQENVCMEFLSPIEGHWVTVLSTKDSLLELSPTDRPRTDLLLFLMWWTDESANFEQHSPPHRASRITPAFPQTHANGHGSLTAQHSCVFEHQIQRSLPH